MTPPDFGQPPRPLWSHWPFVQQRFKAAERLVLFLDYDGTLAPISDHPSKARLSARVRHLLKELAQRPGIWVAVVSGRRLKDLKAMVRLRGLCYVGNHGLELHGPKLRYINPAARASRPLLKAIAKSLKVALRPFPGAWVEDKGLSLSVHFRSVATADLVPLKNRFYEALQPYLEKRQARVTVGKRVLEVRLPVRWNKGTVVQWLLARQRALSDEAGTMPVYIGDDATDEDAFKALGKEGLAISVGRSKLSQAQYRLRSSRDVWRFLQRLLKAREGRA